MRRSVHKHQEKIITIKEQVAKTSVSEGPGVVKADPCWSQG